MIDIGAQQLAEQQRHALAMALRVALRAGVAHAEVEKTIRAEGETTAVVILRGAGNFEQPARRFAGVAAKIRREFPPHNERGNAPAFFDLILQEIFPVLPKVRMKREREQSRRAAAAHDSVEVDERRLRFAVASFFDDPAPAKMLEHDVAARASRFVAKPRRTIESQGRENLSPIAKRSGPTRPPEDENASAIPTRVVIEGRFRKKTRRIFGLN